MCTKICNSQAVQKTLQLYAQNLGTKQPYHPLGLVPMDHCQMSLQVEPTVNLEYSQCYHFRKKLRDLWNKGADLAQLVPPTVPKQVPFMKIPVHDFVSSSYFAFVLRGYAVSLR